MNEHAPTPGVISTAQAAQLLQISDEWIRRLTQMGYLPKVGRGRYNLVAAVRGYCRYLKDEAQKATKSAAENRVRDARAAEIERRMAREDREIVDLDEAMATLEDISGLMLATLGSLPAQITRNPTERRRIEAIVHAAQSRLAVKFAEKTEALATGHDDPSPEEDE